MHADWSKLDAPATVNKSDSDDEGLYFPISPFMIFPEAYGEFAVYLRKGRGFILFTRQGEQFTGEHKATLHQNGVQEVYIRSSQKPDYYRYIDEHLGTILTDESIPLSVRSDFLYEQASSILGEIFETNRLSLSTGSLAKLKNAVRSSFQFLSHRSH
jgi:hypothetical protein